MAIYISGVRNLPEQVQKNKDDIEDLQTADTNLEAKIDQEIADRKDLIKASGNATIIENPTENVAVSLSETETNRNFVVFIDGTPKLNIDETNIVANEDVAINGDLEAYGDIEGHSNLAIDNNITAGGDITATGDVSGDLIKGNTLESNAMVSKSDSDTIQFTAFASGVPHILEFNASTQALTIDGGNILKMENIVDSDGNKRFIEGLASLPTISGITFTYNKWALSGTHLMLVLCASLDNTTILSSGQLFASYNLPNYIKNKITNVWGNFIEIKSVSAQAIGESAQNISFSLGKNNSGVLELFCRTALTINADRNFRIQFDLLIDTD